MIAAWLITLALSSGTYAFIPSALSDMVNSRYKANVTCKMFIIDTNIESLGGFMEDLQSIYPTMWISMDALKG